MDGVSRDPREMRLSSPPGARRLGGGGLADLGALGEGARLGHVGLVDEPGGGEDLALAGAEESTRIPGPIVVARVIEMM